MHITHDWWVPMLPTLPYRQSRFSRDLPTCSQTKKHNQPMTSHGTASHLAIGYPLFVNIYHSPMNTDTHRFTPPTLSLISCRLIVPSAFTILWKLCYDFSETLTFKISSTTRLRRYVFFLMWSIIQCRAVSSFSVYLLEVRRQARCLF